MEDPMTTSGPKLHITNIKTEVLKPSLYNPRKWSEEALAALMESVTRFGMVDPIIINMAPERRNVVIGGHMRLAALTKLGYDEGPAVFVDIPDINKEKRYA